MGVNRHFHASRASQSTPRDACLLSSGGTAYRNNVSDLCASTLLAWSLLKLSQNCGECWMHGENSSAVVTTLFLWYTNLYFDLLQAAPYCHVANCAIDCVNQLRVFKFCTYFVFSLSPSVDIWCMFIYVVRFLNSCYQKWWIKMNI